MKNKVVSLVLFLAIVAGISGLILGAVNSFTAPLIAQNANAELYENLGIYYPDSDFEDISDGMTDGTITAVYKAGDEGYAYQLAGNGFGGTLKILVAFDSKGTIIGVSILEQGETAGFGQENFTEENIQKLYIGKTIDEQVDMRTGSTVTSTAMRTLISAAQASLKTML